MSIQSDLMIENIRRVHNAGNLRAFCDVRITTAGGDWVIRDCRIIQQPGQKACFSLPVLSWNNETGQICYQTILELPAGIKRRISETALRVYKDKQVEAA